MNTANQYPEESETCGIDHALRRAALRAREIAAQTGTPLVVFREGRIERIRVTPAATAEYVETNVENHIPKP